jgi:membrane fusion protein, multidrug efflux system
LESEGLIMPPAKLKRSCRGLGLAACLLALSALPVYPAQGKSPSPATVENPVKETELTTIKLTAQAEQRLGIALGEVARKTVAPTRLFGGEVIVPLAPKGPTSTGYYPLSSATPDELLKLADQQAVADGEVEKAQVQLEAAQVVLKRVEKLVAGEVGSVRAVDDASAQVRLAEKALAVAKTRRALLGTGVAEALRGGRVWVRVPVYVGELRLVDPEKEARVGGVEARPGPTNLLARPVSAPPSANPLTATVDLFYEIEPGSGGVRPGQRVSVSLPLRGAGESLVVPWAAILQDIHGNAWVYEKTAPQTFVRRRVQVVRVAEGDAVLASGPKAGTKVVTDGAAELFGTELGGGK